MRSTTVDSSTGTGTGVWFTGRREVELRSETLTGLGTGMVLVEAETSLVSAGTEMNVYRGEIGDPEELVLPTSRGTHPFPVQYGYQVVGRVLATGPGVEGLEPGQRVFTVHPHQDRFVMPAVTGGPASRRLVTVVPEGIDAEQAAFANLFAVALTALLDVPVRFGDVAVVSGLGVVGTFAAYLARRTAGRLVVVDPLESRRRAAEGIGADACVAPEHAADAVADLSNGRGADVVIEASGAPAALQSALTVTGAEGTVVVLSYYGTRPVPLVLSPEFHYRRQRIVSSMVGAVGSGLQPRWDRDRRLDVAFELLSRFDVDPLVTHRFPLAQAAEAYRLVDTEPDAVLAVLLTYGEVP